MAITRQFLADTGVKRHLKVTMPYVKVGWAIPTDSEVLKIDYASARPDGQFEEVFSTSNPGVIPSDSHTAPMAVHKPGRSVSR